MNHGDQILLRLLGRCLFGTPTDHIPGEVDWVSVYQEARAQAVLPLVFDCLTEQERESLPQALAVRWRQETMSILLKNQQLQNQQMLVVAVLTQAGLPCLIMKGTSVSSLYPKPDLRPLGDIDVLVQPQQQQAAVAALEASGYHQIHKPGDPEHHVTVGKDGVIVELHREPKGVGQAEALAAFFLEAMDRRQLQTQTPVLPEDAQAVALLLHMLSHFLSSSLGLRQLCDWAVFIDAKMTPALWQTVEPILSEYGLLYFTGVITRVCVEAFGLPEERAVWAMDYPADLSREVLEEILRCGNFGSKQENLGRWYFVKPDKKTALGSFLATIGPSCRKHYPPCGKYPVLLPIGFGAVCWNYLRKVVAGEGLARHPLQLIRQSGPKRRLYQSLRPYVTEKERDGR